MDPDPDTAVFISDLQDVNKQDVNVFLLILLGDGRIRIRISD
jgi:hypothetical protein